MIMMMARGEWGDAGAAARVREKAVLAMWRVRDLLKRDTQHLKGLISVTEKLDFLCRSLRV
jgi:hypothetical protein